MVTDSAEAPIPALVLQHPVQIEVRLRRVEARVRGIRRMYEDGRPCLEILDQISAARAALGAVALLVIDDHITGCFEPAAGLELDEARATRLATAIARAARHRRRSGVSRTEPLTSRPPGDRRRAPSRRA